MNKKLLPYLIAGVLLVSACSDTDKKTEPKTELDPNTLSNPLNDSLFIDNKIEALLKDYQLPGMAVAVVSGTDTPNIWTKGYGFANVETQKSITTDTSFWLGSLSKHVMGLAMMIAKDQGVINLDNDVRTLFDAKTEHTIDNPNSAPITYRHLMSHSSGILDSDSYDCAYFVSTDDGEQHSLLNMVEDEGICPEGSPTELGDYLYSYLDEGGIYYSAQENFSQAEPGSEFEYSNIGAALAGFSLELATGQTLADFAATNLFTPLNMTNTNWESDKLSKDNIATAYFYDDDEEQVSALPNYELATWPDGGLRSSVSDVTRLLSILLNKGEALGVGQVIQPDSLTEMQTATSEDYGLFTELFTGFEYAGEEHELFGHSGSDPGAFSYMFYNKDKNTGIVIISNGDDESIDDDLLSDSLLNLIVTLFEASELMKE